MGLVFAEVAFTDKAPTASELADKIKELTGLTVTVEPISSDLQHLYGQHAHLSFACVPEERLEIFSYRPGAAKAYYSEFMPGFEHLPAARFAVGLREPAGTQSVYLRNAIGLEPTLLMSALIALESLGGRPSEPITEADRSEYGKRIIEAELQTRRRKLKRSLVWAALIYALLLPISLPLLVFGMLVSLALLPWRLWKAQDVLRHVQERQDHRALLDAIPDHIDFVPASVADFPDVDRIALLYYTDCLESLGFVQCLDYSPRYDIALNLDGVARLLIHPVQHCIAEINQVFPHNGPPTPMRCAIGSLFEGGWSLSTTDRELQPLSWAWRRPTQLWTCHFDLSIDELWAKHLRRREQMMAAFQLRLMSHMSAEVYFAHERQAMADRKEVLSLKKMETIRAEMKAFERSPIHEWLGNLQ